jgi:hypothetical protein
MTDIMVKIFNRIYIKSETDLPKVSSNYFVNIKGKGIGLNVTKFDINDKADKTIWLNTIEWYLTK